MRIPPALGLAAWAYVSAVSAAAAQPVTITPVTITFVQAGDFTRIAEHEGRGGLARLAAAIKAERAKGPTIVIHTGDAIGLSPEDQGASSIDILNEIGIDVMVPGKQEFHFVPEVFQERLNQARFTVVASNITGETGDAPANSVADTIIEADGVRIGFYGLTGEETAEGSNPGDTRFAPALDTAAAKAADLRAAGVDLVAAVTHTPARTDAALFAAGHTDLIFSGGDERIGIVYNGAVAMTESAPQGDRIVVTEIVVSKDGADIEWSPNFRIVDTANAAPDPDIAALVERYSGDTGSASGDAIGTTQTALDSSRALVRSQETAIGNLIADAIREAADADVGLFNGGNIRAGRQYAPGTALTRQDILAELPFGNATVKIAVSGADLRAALENGFSKIEEVGGRFPQLSGVSTVVDFAQPPGARVVSVSIGDAPLDDGKTYTLATNDFISGGGDGYEMFAGAERLTSDAETAAVTDQVIGYISARGTVAPEVEGRITTQ